MMEPLLGTPKDLKASLGKFNVAGWKAGGALALCLLSVGLISYHSLLTQHVSDMNLPLHSQDLHVAGREIAQDLMSVPSKASIPADIGAPTRDDLTALNAQQKEQAA